MLKMIIKLIRNRINLFGVPLSNASHSFLLPFILSKLDINLGENESVLVELSFSVFLISLIALLCFINILAYFLTYYFIQKVDYETKYPKLSKIINYYKNFTILYLIIEIIICLTCLLSLNIYSLITIYSNINSV